LAAARLLDPSGSQPATLEIVGDRVTADMPAYGWIEVEAEYASSPSERGRGEGATNDT
jgi:phage major head subunit gpT-like protein